jgi:putative transposase
MADVAERLPALAGIYDHYSNWNRRGIWEKALEALNKLLRKKNGKKPTTNYGIIDSQSVRTIAASEQ